MLFECLGDFVQENMNLTVSQSLKPHFELLFFMECLQQKNLKGLGQVSQWKYCQSNILHINIFSSVGHVNTSPATFLDKITFAQKKSLNYKP